jgi:hypothetical protein
LEPRQLLAQTVGLFEYDPANTYDGYTLMSPEFSEDAYLIDMEGQLVHEWKTNYEPGNMAYMLPDGSLLRAQNIGLSNVGQWQAAGVGGKVQLIGWDNKVLWNYDYRNAQHIQHHDIEPILNEDGSLHSVLMIAFDYMGTNQAIQAGRDPAKLTRVNPQGTVENWLLPDSVVEVVPTGRTTGEIVWEWHLKDHFVQDFDSRKANWKGPNGVSEHPELVDINYVALVGQQADMTHANGVDYNAERDEIVVSIRSFSEIWVIDHSTTTAEARGHTGGDKGKGGDLLWRWGNPAAYNQGNKSDQMLFFQHNAEWTPDGTAITVYNNGWRAAVPGGGYTPADNWSSADEIIPPLDGNGDYIMTPGEAAGPADFNWRYGGPDKPDFFGAIISGVQRLPNGNTLISEGTEGHFFEVTRDVPPNPADQVVWDYVNPVVSTGILNQYDPIPDSSFAPGLLKDNFVFHAYRYGEEYFSDDFDLGLLTSKATIELNPGDKVGLWVPGANTWYLNLRSDGSVNHLIQFDGGNVPAWFQPVAGDWDGNGVDTVGLFNANNNKWFFYSDANASVDYSFQGPALPSTSFRAVAGNWDGIGGDTVGLYDPATGIWYLNNAFDGTAEPATLIEWQGPKVGAHWQVIVGDWDGNGTDTPGLYNPRNNRWFLYNDTDNKTVDIKVFGPQHNSPWWQAIAGDWNSTGSDKIGLYDNRTNAWYLNNQLDGSVNDLVVVNGPQHNSPGWVPLAGNWDGRLRPPFGGDALTLDPAFAAIDGAQAAALAATQLDSVFDKAVRYVSAVEGSQAAAVLRGVTVQLVDLPGDLLGRVVRGSLIQIDVDAAGRGWSTGALKKDRVDLLTAVMHEIGHVLGEEHADHGLMNDTLRPGVRALWEADVDAVFGGVS